MWTTYIGLGLIIAVVIVHIVYYPSLRRIKKDLASFKDYFKDHDEPY